MNRDYGLKFDGYDKDGMPTYESLDPHESLICDLLGSSPQGKIWSYIWPMQDIDFSKADICEGEHISRTSLYKVWHIFINSEIIIPSRMYKGQQLFKVNKNHFLVRKMFDVLSNWINYCVEADLAEIQLRKKIYQRDLKCKKKKK